MATIYWEGKSEAIAQVTTATVGGTIGTETFTLTVGGFDIEYTASGSDTATTTAEALRDAWNDATHPYCTSITATADSGVVTLTADTAGVPFIVTASATGSATLVAATPTASSGPNDWATAGNWSTGSVPTDSDVVVIENNDVPILWGLDQSAVTLTELRIMQSYTGRIGLSTINFTVDSDTIDSTKPEYRESHLAIGATTINIGQHHGIGTPVGADRIVLDTGSVQTQLNIFNTSSTSADDPLEPVRWKGTHASNAVNITRGRVGMATDTAGDTATIATLNVSATGSTQTDTDVQIAPGVTLTTLNQAGGIIALGTDVTTINQSGGSLTTFTDSAITTANLAGTGVLSASGTITTLNVSPTGFADFSKDPRSRTVTNCSVHKGSQLNLDNGSPLSVTFTNGIDFVQCSPADVTLTMSPHVTVELSAV